MALVEIYTTPLCPYCWRAKRLLGQKGVSFVEIDLWQHPERRSEMVGRADGRRTVPQLSSTGARSGARTNSPRSSGAASSMPCWALAERPRPADRPLLRLSP